jgi:hypothetical protein
MAEELRIDRPATSAGAGRAVGDQLAQAEARDETAFDRMNREQRLLVALDVLRSNVNNGGFDSYFSFSGGDHGTSAAEAAELVDPRLGQLLREACALFGDSYPADRDKRFDIVDRLNEEQPDLLDQLDTRYYDLEAQISIDDWADNFVWSHSDAFFR